MGPGVGLAAKSRAEDTTAANLRGEMACLDKLHVYAKTAPGAAPVRAETQEQTPHHRRHLVS